MPWWAWLWTGLMALLGGAGVIDDLRGPRPAWYAALGAASTLGCLVLVGAFFEPGLAEVLGRGAPAWLLLCAGWVVIEARNDLHDELAEPDADRMLVTSGVLMVVLLFAPALILGAIVSARAWGLLG